MGAGIALLATVVSLIGSGTTSMWVDEGATLGSARRSVVDLWRMTRNIDVVHGLYYLIMHGWISVAGTSAFALRLPSAVFVGVGAAGAFVLGRQLGSTRWGVVAGVLYAILPRVTGVGMDARSYAMAAAAAAWLTVLFVSHARRPSGGKLFGYAVLVAVSTSLNIFGILMLVVHGVAMLTDRRLRWTRSFWSWFAAGTVGALGGLPVVITALSQSAQIGASDSGLFGLMRQVVVNQWFLGETPTVWVPGNRVLANEALEIWKPAAVGLAIVCWLLMSWAVARGLPSSAQPSHPSKPFVDARPLLIAWVVLPTALLVTYALVRLPIYNPRYMTFCIAAVALLVSAGLLRLPRAATLVVGLLIIALTIPIYVSQRGPYSKGGADWQEVAAFVQARSAPGQAVYFAPRDPPKGDTVGMTGRIAALTYAEAYADKVDLTLAKTPDETADLMGRSILLKDAVSKLEGIDAVFVIRRVDYPAEASASEDAVLEMRGFRPTDSWSGPLNRVTEFRR